MNKIKPNIKKIKKTPQLISKSSQLFVEPQSEFITHIQPPTPQKTKPVHMSHTHLQVYNELHLHEFVRSQNVLKIQCMCIYRLYTKYVRTKA